MFACVLTTRELKQSPRKDSALCQLLQLSSLASCAFNAGPAFVLTLSTFLDIATTLRTSSVVSREVLVRCHLLTAVSLLWLTYFDLKAALSCFPLALTGPLPSEASQTSSASA